MNEQQVLEIIQDVENYDLEFKAAQGTQFSQLVVVEYCAAMANENGGKLLLGVNNDRVIVGTNSFEKTWNTLAHKITDALDIRVKVFNIETSKGRVLLFDIPRHKTATPCMAPKKSQYTYPIRDGESLVEMDQEALKEIFAEKDTDWSAQFAKGVTYKDLDQDALKSYRLAWAEHMKEPGRNEVGLQKMLQDVGLMVDKNVTNAALLLFGSEMILARVLPDAEIIFEWRNNKVDIPFGERINWRAGFMTIKDEIWSVINKRNTVFRYQTGFSQRNIPAFDEESIRESVVNAFTHRDYTLSGRSIVIKASPEELYIENPGRLMPGVTLQNMIDKSIWRNRLLAESLEKIHVMERSSQGVDKIYTHTIRDGKGIPKYSLSNDPTVSLTIPAVLKDQEFIVFLEAITQKDGTELSIKEIIELEQIRQGVKQRGTELNFKDKFLTMGVIERVGTGKGSRYILSHRYYKYAGDAGTHTRLVGLTRNVKRELILTHLNKNGKITNAELQEAMPELEMLEIYRLLKSMSKDKLIVHVGSSRYGHWELLQNKDNNTQLKLLEN